MKKICSIFISLLVTSLSLTSVWSDEADSFKLKDLEWGTSISGIIDWLEVQDDFWDYDKMGTFGIPAEKAAGAPYAEAVLTYGTCFVCAGNYSEYEGLLIWLNCLFPVEDENTVSEDPSDARLYQVDCDFIDNIDSSDIDRCRNIYEGVYETLVQQYGDETERLEDDYLTKCIWYAEDGSSLSLSFSYDENEVLAFDIILTAPDSIQQLEALEAIRSGAA